MSEIEEQIVIIIAVAPAATVAAIAAATVAATVAAIATAIAAATATAAAIAAVVLIQAATPRPQRPAYKNLSQINKTEIPNNSRWHRKRKA